MTKRRKGVQLLSWKIVGEGAVSGCKGETSGKVLHGHNKIMRQAQGREGGSVTMRIVHVV